MDPKTAEIIEKVAKNADILQKIFNFLNLQDQLNTASVCKDFEYVIENFIWKYKCKDIQIQGCFKNYLRINDATNTDHDLLENEGKLLFQIIAKYIERLQVMDGDKDIILNNFYNFEKLTILQFKHMNVTKQNLQYMVRNCKNLETISFHNWTNFTRNLFLATIDILGKLKCLKHFKFFTNGFFSSTLLTFLLYKLNLTSITLDCKHFYGVKSGEYADNCLSLEQLTIGSFEDTDNWLGFKDKLLKHFPNLKTLTLYGKGVVINDNDMFLLAKNCKNLQNLNLKNCQLNITNFPPELQLKKLSFDGCSLLTWKNLKNILETYNLEEFITFNTVYMGIYDLSFINVNNSLKTLEITTEQTLDFLKFFKSLNTTLSNLTTLRYQFFKYFPENILRNLANLCPNLQKFFLKNIVVSIEDLMKLSELKMLRFNIFPSMSGEFLFKLLTHPSITYLSLGMSADMAELVYNKKLDLTILKEEYNDSLFNLSVSNINFKFIKIPFIIFHKYQNIFLDLLTMKKNLKLMLFGFNSRRDMCSQIYIKQLLNHKKFPAHLKAIKICNKYFDVQNLRDNFDSSVEEFSNIYHCTICF